MKRLLALAAALAVTAVYAHAVIADAHLAAPAPTAIVTDAHGTFITQAGHVTVRSGGGRQVEYGYWPIDPPDRVVRATIALEDRRFWSHPGVDPLAVLRAAWQHVRSGHGSGASTIAMQVARMQHPRPRTLWAKAVEAGTAVVITARYGHAAVLAQYLRLAPYGEGSHGIAHAARWFFDQPAADLNWAQAALLSAVPQAPGLMALRQGGLPRAAARAAQALAAMDLPPDTLAQALDDLRHIAPTPAPQRPGDLQTVLHLEHMAREDGREQMRATLDLPMQRWVTQMAITHLASWRQAGAQQVAVMVVRRQSRAVLADVASAGYDSRPAGAIDYSAAPRSPGSTLKPFLYALGLDRGLIAPQDVLADLPEAASGISNADHDFLGPLLPRQALANSRNVPAAHLLRRIGIDAGFGFLRTLGLHDGNGPADRYGLSMAVGALPTSLDRLMRAYETLAEDGVDDNLVWLDGATRAPRRLMSKDSARLIADFLSDPLARLPSFPRYGSSEFPMAVALKTGTSQGYRDAWTIAWSHDYLVGVWIGRADAGPMTRLSGARAAAGLAQAVMLRLHGLNRSDLVAGAFPPTPRPHPGRAMHRHRRRRRRRMQSAADGMGRRRSLPKQRPITPPGHRAARHERAFLAQPRGAPIAQPPGTPRQRRPGHPADRLAGRRPAHRRGETRRSALLDHDARPPPLPDPPAAAGRSIPAGHTGRRVIRFSARLTPDSTAFSDAVTMLRSMPTPKTADPSARRSSRYATALALAPEPIACSW